MVIYRCEDLEAYKLSYEMAVEIFNVTLKFPKEEKYSLVDQMRRSSRSVAANIREGFAKRRYSDVFIRHLNGALGSAEETQTWLDFSYDAGYISVNEGYLKDNYKRISSMIYRLMKSWQKFDR